MEQSIIHITLLVTNYDQGIDFFVNKLSFELIEDTLLSDQKRWVLIKPPGSSTCCILLAQPRDETQRFAVGNQGGGRVFLFLSTDNFQRDYLRMLANGVVFVREPINEAYGTVAVFKDLSGNLWDLIERKT